MRVSPFYDSTVSEELPHFHLTTEFVIALALDHKHNWLRASNYRDIRNGENTVVLSHGNFQNGQYHIEIKDQFRGLKILAREAASFTDSISQDEYNAISNGQHWVRIYVSEGIL